MISWGIIGCGDVCEVKSGPAFNKVPNSKLIAVMRRDASKAEDFARRHNVPKFYSDANELIHDPQINAIYIATPPSSHEDHTLEALKAKKPVYVEKPVTVDSASCKRMIDFAARSNGKVSVAHYRRGLPLFKKVKALINEGAIGNVRLIQLEVLQPPKQVNASEDYWRVDPKISGGGLFHDLSPHQLDIMYWIFGTPKTINGTAINQSMRYNIPDLTSRTITFEKEIFFNGIWAFSISSSAAEDSCEIIGDKGKLKFAFFKHSAIELTTDSGTEILQMEYPENIQLHMIDAVTKYFRGEGPNPCSLDEALIVMKMMEA